jgi:hypothetical protein
MNCLKALEQGPDKACYTSGDGKPLYLKIILYHEQSTNRIFKTFKACFGTG